MRSCEPPEISVSMFDMFRTREDEKQTPCDCCQRDPDTCSFTRDECEDACLEYIAEREAEARRDEA